MTMMMTTVLCYYTFMQCFTQYLQSTFQLLYFIKSTVTAAKSIRTFSH